MLCLYKYWLTWLPLRTLSVPRTGSNRLTMQFGLQKAARFHRSSQNQHFTQKWTSSTISLPQPKADLYLFKYSHIPLEIRRALTESLKKK